MDEEGCCFGVFSDYPAALGFVVVLLSLEQVHGGSWLVCVLV